MSTNQIDPMRHLSVFSPHAFGEKRVDVIGAGATGSRIVLSLAKLGIANIHVWDFDTVEEHNIANQIYGLSDIGKLKTEALAAIVKEQTGLDITVHNEEVNGSQRLGEVVFLLTDTMSSRREIWDGAIKKKRHVKMMFETRMGIDNGRIYAVNPMKPTQIRGWEGSLYDDDEADQVAACGTSITVGPTAEVVSGMAVWQMLRWFAIERGEGGDDVLEHEVMFGLRQMMIPIAQQFAA